MVWLMNTFWAIKRRVSEALYLWRSSPDDNFEYSPLSTDPATAPIRLLDLEDGGHGDILRCRLYHADLNDDLPLTEYEAVSYSWNRNIIRNRVVVVLSRLVPGLRWQEYSVEEASPTRLLVCNGRVLKIQPNLYDFLVRLRAQRRHCSLWIDAICINQDEANEQARIEKHSQILRMSRIYAAAIRVLVWLGESSGSHMAALPDFLTGLPTLKQSQDENFRTRHQISHFRSPDARSVVRVIVQTLDLRDSLWHTLWNMQRRLHYVRQLTLLANREYFRRMWVVQELFFARELAFFTGSVQLSWDAIVKGQQIVEAFSTTSELVSDPLRHRGLLTLPHVVASGKKRRDRGGQGDHDLQSHWSLDDILFLLRDHVATRPEDKVLSILGLIDVATAEEVTAGVMDQGSVRLDQLYYNCATAIARDRGWPYILTLVALGAAEDTRLPSWIPNFQQPMLPKPFWYFGCEDFAVRTAQRSPNFSVRATTRGQIHTATDNSSTKSTGASDTGLPDYTVNTSPSWTLTVPLITFSTIVQVGESHSELDETQSNRMQGHIFDLLTRLGQRYTPTGELTLDALMRTLTADVFNQREDPMTERRKDSLRAEFYTWLAATFNLIETPTLPGTSTIYDMRARQFGVSTQRDTPSINGYDIDRTACIDAFVSMHNSAVYPVSKLFLRPETTKPWIPEVLHQPEPGDEEANTFWMTGGFTLDKAVDWAVRYLDFKVNGLHNAIDQVYRDRRVFRTGSGHLGSGPKNIRLGDVVCFVAGAQTPFVFRRVGQSGLGSRVSIGGQPVPLAVDLGQVRVVGAAYVHGVMHKEFVEGLAGSSFAGVSVV